MKVNFFSQKTCKKRDPHQTLAGMVKTASEAPPERLFSEGCFPLFSTFQPWAPLGHPRPQKVTRSSHKASNLSQKTINQKHKRSPKTNLKRTSGKCKISRKCNFLCEAKVSFNFMVWVFWEFGHSARTRGGESKTPTKKKCESEFRHSA